jgi:hypothetical protein
MFAICFTQTKLDLWNTLPQSVIDAKDVRQFEIRLDKYWEHQDVNTRDNFESFNHITSEASVFQGRHF